MTVEARSRLSKSGYSAVAGWVKRPEVRLAATEFKAEFGGLEVDEDTQTFVVRLFMTVYRPTRVIGASPDLAEALDPAQAMMEVDAKAASVTRELTLSASQMASATKLVDVAASVVAQLQSNGVPIDSGHFPNVYAFLQLALCAGPADWDLSGAELASRLHTGSPVLFSSDGIGTRTSDHASEEDERARDTIRHEIRGPKRIRAPYAGGTGKRKTTDKRAFRLWVVAEVLREFPDATWQLVSRGPKECGPMGRYYRQLLSREGQNPPSPRTIQQDFADVQAVPTD